MPDVVSRGIDPHRLIQDIGEDDEERMNIIATVMIFCSDCYMGSSSVCFTKFCYIKIRRRTAMEQI